MLKDERTHIIQVGLIEENGLGRDAIRAALQSQAHFEVAFAYPRCDEIPGNVPNPDVLLFSTAYPCQVFGEGLTLDYWRMRFQNARIFLLTNSRVPETVRILVHAGIDGYAVRNAITLDELVGLIDKAHSCTRTGPALCATTRKIFERRADPTTDLTRREMQVIRSLHDCGPGYGKSKLAASGLAMDLDTFRVHIRNICAKLNVCGAAEILHRSIELGLIEDAEAYHAL